MIESIDKYRLDKLTEELKNKPVQMDFEQEAKYLLKVFNKMDKIVKRLNKKHSA